jgi:two-component system, LuxR family, response regulator FixJ
MNFLITLDRDCGTELFQQIERVGLWRRPYERPHGRLALGVAGASFHRLQCCALHPALHTPSWVAPDVGVSVCNPARYAETDVRNGTYIAGGLVPEGHVSQGVVARLSPRDGRRGFLMADIPLVHVVDDDEAVRESLALLLESAGVLARTYDSAAAFLKALPNLASGCVLTDVRMPDLDGLELQRRLLELGVMMPVIVMTGHGDVPIAVEALKAGAADFLEKPFDDAQLLAAVSSALATSQRAQDEGAAVAGIARRLASLTPREREVLDRLVTGQPNKTIAYDLGSSPRTVEVHRARVMEKMGVRSLPELVRMTIAAERATPPGKVPRR